MRRDLTTVRRWKPAAPVVLGEMAALVVLGVIAILLAAGASRLAAGHADVPAADPGIVLRGPGDVAVVNQVYEPGQTSGWHTHAGLHAVAVLTGELTVYDGE
jgi:quercetin dioxygenase-like cupin family protein